MDTIEQLAQEIIDRVNRGELDKAIVARMFRNIIAGEFNPPSWWRSSEEQLAKARQLWPDAVLPEPPREFVPRTQSEVLLLHVPDTIDRYLKLIAEANEGVFEAEEGVTNNLAIHGQLAPIKADNHAVQAEDRAAQADQRIDANTPMGTDVQTPGTLDGPNGNDSGTEGGTGTDTGAGNGTTDGTDTNTSPQTTNP